MEEPLEERDEKMHPEKDHDEGPSPAARLVAQSFGSKARNARRRMVS